MVKVGLGKYFQFCTERLASRCSLRSTVMLSAQQGQESLLPQVRSYNRFTDLEMLGKARKRRSVFLVCGSLPRPYPLGLLLEEEAGKG